jgi:uncharacterized protein YaaQ
LDPKFDDSQADQHQSTFEDYPLHLWQQALDVNLTGLFLCAQAVSKPMLEQTESLAEFATNSLSSHPDIEIKELESAIQEALNSERAVLRTLLQDGIISDEVFSDLIQEIDSAIIENQSELIQAVRMQGQRDIRDLMTVIIQEKDLEMFTRELQPLGFPITHIASTGGFLGRKNATLLIGIPKGKKANVESIIRNAAQVQVKIVADDLDTDEIPDSSGATLFTINVERYEEL